MRREDKTAMAREKAAGQLVFEELKPFCVTVMREASISSLSSLQEAVKSLPQDTAIPSQLVPYLTLPLTAAVKRAGR